MTGPKLVHHEGEPFPERDTREWSSKVRAEYGCVVTFENDAGETLVVHQTGPAQVALAAAIDAVQGLDASFRIVSYSTPLTILADITGARSATHNAAGRRVPQVSPEVGAASAIGRSDAIHARLWKSSGEKKRRWRAEGRLRGGKDTTAATAAAAAMRAARTHCAHGHPLAGDNLYVTPEGKKRCRTCRARNVATYRAKHG